MACANAPPLPLRPPLPRQGRTYVLCVRWLRFYAQFYAKGGAGRGGWGRAGHMPSSPRNSPKSRAASGLSLTGYGAPMAAAAQKPEREERSWQFPGMV